MDLPTRVWTENQLAESEIVTDKRISALHDRIAALEKVVRTVLRISQEEMDALLGKP